MGKSKSIHPTKTHPSRLVERARAGEKVIIARGKTPVTRLIPLEAIEPRGRFGAMRGLARVTAAFLKLLPSEELDRWGVSDVRLLLDTHTFLWWLDGDRRLSRKARTLIGEAANVVFVSTASAWEISTKARLGKLLGAFDVAADIVRRIAGQGFAGLDLTIIHAQRAGRLPKTHRDPFDRMMIAQSQYEDLPIVNNQRLFDSYGVTRIWWGRSDPQIMGSRRRARLLSRGADPAAEETTGGRLKRHRSPVPDQSGPAQTIRGTSPPDARTAPRDDRRGEVYPAISMRTKAPHRTSERTDRTSLTSVAVVR